MRNLMPYLLLFDGLNKDMISRLFFSGIPNEIFTTEGNFRFLLKDIIPQNVH